MSKSKPNFAGKGKGESSRQIKTLNAEAEQFSGEETHEVNVAFNSKDLFYLVIDSGAEKSLVKI